MANNRKQNRVYLFASIWILYGIFRFFRAIRWGIQDPANFSSIANSGLYVAEMVVIGAFCMAIGFGIVFKSKYLSLELISLPMALFAYSVVVLCFDGVLQYNLLFLDYIFLLFVLPTQSLVKQLNISPAIQDRSIPVILSWIFIEVLLFNITIYYLVWFI